MANCVFSTATWTDSSGQRHLLDDVLLSSDESDLPATASVVERICGDACDELRSNHTISVWHADEGSFDEVDSDADLHATIRAFRAAMSAGIRNNGAMLVEKCACELLSPQIQIQQNGAHGIWVLACNAVNHTMFTQGHLEILLEGADARNLEVRALSLAAIWTLCEVHDTRLRLVELGVVDRCFKSLRSSGGKQPKLREIQCRTKQYAVAVLAILVHGSKEIRDAVSLKLDELFSAIRLAIIPRVRLYRSAPGREYFLVTCGVVCLYARTNHLLYLLHDDIH